MKILIAGDLVPTLENEELFAKGEIYNNLSDEMKKKWFDVDYRIINLECVIGNKNKLSEIVKTGPCLICNEDCINGIKELKPDLLTLANNHMFDFGSKGINSTCNILDKNNISYTGIINSCTEMYKPFVLERDGIKVGIFNICENEFSGATQETIGCNTFIESKSYYEIMNAKKELDKLIVIFHGGREYYQYPSPNLQRIARGFVDFGADCVIIQHSHCIGCKEEYKKSQILYGQGNFIFYNDKYAGKNKELIKDSLLVCLQINKNSIDIEYYPLEQNKKLVDFSNSIKIMNDFEFRSKEIMTDRFIYDKYNELSNNNYNYIIYRIHNKSIIFKFLWKLSKGKIARKLYKKKDLAQLLNSIECEAHRELVINSIKNEIKRKSNKNEK